MTPAVTVVVPIALWGLARVLAGPWTKAQRLENALRLDDRSYLDAHLPALSAPDTARLVAVLADEMEQRGDDPGAAMEDGRFETMLRELDYLARRLRYSREAEHRDPRPSAPVRWRQRRGATGSTPG
jgi:hypothetical protein